MYSWCIAMSMGGAEEFHRKGRRTRSCIYGRHSVDFTWVL